MLSPGLSLASFSRECWVSSRGAAGSTRCPFRASPCGGRSGGLSLSTAFVLAVALGGDPAFLRNLLVVGPAFALAAAGSAAGSLALARRAQDRALLEATGDVTAAGLSDGGAREVLRGGD